MKRQLIGIITFLFIIFGYVGLASFGLAQASAMLPVQQTAVSPTLSLTHRLSELVHNLTELAHQHSRHSLAGAPTTASAGISGSTSHSRSNIANGNSSDSSGQNIRQIGIFISDAPDDPAAIPNLHTLAYLGVDTIYNYSSFDGTQAQVNAYLDAANQAGLKVIMSLNDLYDQIGSGQFAQSAYPEYGATNDQIARSVVTDFAAHPAVWGFSITDERPEAPTDLTTWQSVLETRYRLIKSLTNKPVMAVLVGYTAPDSLTRQAFLSQLTHATDTFALDYYPVPFDPIARIHDIGHDLASVDQDGWFIEQDFSWASYPATARQIGYDPSQARLPTTDEMVNMARQALTGGAKNLLFYSYFDIKNNPNQLSNLRAAIRRIRQL